MSKQERRDPASVERALRAAGLSDDDVRDYFEARGLTVKRKGIYKNVNFDCELGLWTRFEEAVASQSRRKGESLNEAIRQWLDTARPKQRE